MPCYTSESCQIDSLVFICFLVSKHTYVLGAFNEMQLMSKGIFSLDVDSIGSVPLQYLGAFPNAENKLAAAVTRI